MQPTHRGYQKLLLFIYSHSLFLLSKDHKRISCNWRLLYFPGQFHFPKPHSLGADSKWFKNADIRKSKFFQMVLLDIRSLPVCFTFLSFPLPFVGFLEHIICTWTILSRSFLRKKFKTISHFLSFHNSNIQDYFYETELANFYAYYRSGSSILAQI